MRSSKMTNPGRGARKIEHLQRIPKAAVRAVGSRHWRVPPAEPTVLLATVSYLTYKVSETATCI
jgi:hypothetical protein